MPNTTLTDGVRERIRQSGAGEAYIGQLTRQGLNEAYRAELAFLFRELVMTMKKQGERANANGLLLSFKISLAQLRNAHAIAMEAHIQLFNGSDGGDCAEAD
jgi:hypothetical protein